MLFSFGEASEPPVVYLSHVDGLHCSLTWHPEAFVRRVKPHDQPINTRQVNHRPRRGETTKQRQGCEPNKLLLQGYYFYNFTPIFRPI